MKRNYKLANKQKDIKKNIKEIDLKICQNMQQILQRKENVMIKFFNFLYNIKTTKKYLKLGYISIKNLTFHCSKYPIDMDKAVIEITRFLVMKRLLNTVLKWNVVKNKSLCIKLPQMDDHVIRFDETRSMLFFI